MYSLPIIIIIKVTNQEECDGYIAWGVEGDGGVPSHFLKANLEPSRTSLNINRQKGHQFIIHIVNSSLSDVCGEYHVLVTWICWLHKKTLTETQHVFGFIIAWTFS